MKKTLLQRAQSALGLHITRLAAAALLLSASVFSSLAACGVDVNRTLILLQENGGYFKPIADALDGPAEDAARGIIDGVVEAGETLKFQDLARGHYQRFVNLTDENATRAKLLEELIRQTVDGYTVDLAVLGHGTNEVLVLHNKEELTGYRKETKKDAGTNGNIRTLITDARRIKGSNFQFKLRLVNMCNCYGSTVNDDWLAIGAQTVVGSKYNNYMPEPMTTWFWDDFVKKDKSARQAAADSYAASKVIWQVVPGYTTPARGTRLTKIQESAQVVSGDGNLIFNDECGLKVNETQTVVVRADRTHTFPGIYLVPGQKYKFTATGTWNNGGTRTDANGYRPGWFDGGRRHSSNMMCLVGERFRHNGDVLSFISGSGFKIGTSRTYTATAGGYLNLFANDNLLFYGDNSGQVTVKIKRVRAN